MFLAPIPITDSSFESSLVAVGSNIYAIGGNEPSSRVSILDCRSHLWHEAPPMQVARGDTAANVLDGKIYVAGGFEDFDSSNWMEFFDTKTQTWELVSSPHAEICSSNILNSAVVEDNIYMFGENDVAYKPKEDRWEAVGDQYINFGWVSPSDYCVIDNVLYCYLSDTNKLVYYDPMIGYWKTLNGLEGLPRFFRPAYVKLLDYDGKIAVFWDKYLPFSDCKIKLIWCAVISLERRNTLEGKVEWVDAVLKVPNDSNNIKAFAITL